MIRVFSKSTDSETNEVGIGSRSDVLEDTRIFANHSNIPVKKEDRVFSNMARPDY